jgi:ATP-dependent Clp protease adaptor protein ClpS
LSGTCNGPSITVTKLVIRNSPVVVEPDLEQGVKEAFAKGWSVVVWNDPINLMEYVTHVFRTVLGMSKDVAIRHMMEVHQQGKSIVARETKEKAEMLVHRLQAYSLNTTMEPS